MHVLATCTRASCYTRKLLRAIEPPLAQPRPCDAQPRTRPQVQEHAAAWGCRGSDGGHEAGNASVRELAVRRGAARGLDLLLLLEGDRVALACQEYLRRGWGGVMCVCWGGCARLCASAQSRAEEPSKGCGSTAVSMAALAYMQVKLARHYLFRGIVRCLQHSGALVPHLLAVWARGGRGWWALLCATATA